MPTLLAVDLGLRTGLAHYSEEGRLVWYRSTHFGTAGQLKRGAYRILSELDDLGWLVVEGGGRLQGAWSKEAHRRDLHLVEVSAETWRETMMYPRQRATGERAKAHADTLARRVIDWSDAPKPTGALRHDAAEAILVGLWGALEIGLLSSRPPFLQHVINTGNNLLGAGPR